MHVLDFLLLIGGIEKNWMIFERIVIKLILHIGSFTCDVLLLRGRGVSKNSVFWWTSWVNGYYVTQGYKNFSRGDFKIFCKKNFAGWNFWNFFLKILTNWRKFPIRRIYHPIHPPSYALDVKQLSIHLLFLQLSFIVAIDVNLLHI